MGNFKIVVPEAATNQCLNPSAETTGNYTAESGTTVTRSTTYAKFGLYSYRVQTDADNEGVELTLSACSNAAHYVTMRVAGTLPTAWDWSLDDSNWTSPTSLESIDGTWTLYGASFVAGQANGSTKLSIHQNGAGSGDFYIDGVMVEAAAYWTTYVDGDQAGCAWNGTDHGSTSTRSAVSRAGGRVKDLADDFSFYVTGWSGYGMPPQTMGVDSYALMPGGELNQVKVEPRTMVMVGEFVGTSLSNLHALRQALEEEMAPDKYPQDADGWQPVRVRYEGTTVHKETLVHYEGGLEGGIRDGFSERCLLRFLGVDPYWYEIGNSAAALDSNDTATLRYLGARLKSTGQWDDLGLTANPDSGGTVHAICVASDGSVYFGGDFVALNSDDSPAEAGCDRIARYDPATGTFHVLVGDGDVGNGIVYDIIEGPDGTIYLCGTFTAVNGVGTADYLVSYIPSSDTWSSVGDPADGATITAAYAMAMDSDGNLYVVGNFENWAGVAAADYIAKWDGSSWAGVGTLALSGAYPYDIAIDSQDNIVLAGAFTHATLEDYILRYDGSSWDDLDSGTQTGSVYSVEFAADDTLYLAGSFVNQGGDADCDYVCAWNGRQFLSMTGGATLAAIWKLALAPDGRVFVAGIGGLGAGEITAWNGSAWEVWDTAAAAYTVALGRADPVVGTSYDIWIGDDASASCEIAGLVSVSNAGKAPRYPVIRVSRSGGTSATLYSIRNETTGKALMFNYGLLDGETLTIDLRPGRKTIRSSMFGARPDAMLANSDLGSWELRPGTNQVTCFVDEADSPTVVAWLEWRDAYRGAD